MTAIGKASVRVLLELDRSQLNKLNRSIPSRITRESYNGRLPYGANARNNSYNASTRDLIKRDLQNVNSQNRRAQVQRSGNSGFTGEFKRFNARFLGFSTGALTLLQGLLTIAQGQERAREEVYDASKLQTRLAGFFNNNATSVPEGEEKDKERARFINALYVLKSSGVNVSEIGESIGQYIDVLTKQSAEGNETATKVLEQINNGEMSGATAFIRTFERYLQHPEILKDYGSFTFGGTDMIKLVQGLSELAKDEINRFVRGDITNEEVEKTNKQTEDAIKINDKTFKSNWKMNKETLDALDGFIKNKDIDRWLKTREDEHTANLNVLASLINFNDVVTEATTAVKNFTVAVTEQTFKSNKTPYEKVTDNLGLGFLISNAYNWKFPKIQFDQSARTPNTSYLENKLKYNNNKD